MNRTRKIRLVLSTWVIGLLCAIAVGHAAAQVNGAIYTTTSDGTTVNGNIYAAKEDVYLTGGPQNQNNPGLVPDGVYVFQVTDPSGAVLLSTDDIACRQVVVSGGRIVGVPATTPPPACLAGAFHAIGTPDSSNGNTPVQLIPYIDTPNPGGEYKAWLTPVGSYDNCSNKNSNVVYGFCDSDSKTDNFKVKTGLAQVLVCKFIDLTGNGLSSDDALYDLLPGWTFTATGVDANGLTNQTVSVQSQDGCVLFAVSQFDNPVTVTEESRFGWTETWPVDNQGNPINPVTVTLKHGDSVEVDFANFNTEQNGALLVSKDAQPSYQLGWTIQKSVVGASKKSSSGSGTFDYSVSVGHDEGSGWTVTGYIRVTSEVSQTGVTITDAVDDGGVCSITDGKGGVNESLVANVELKVPYACTYAAKPDPYAAGTNTATVSLQDGTQRTGTAVVDFSSATVVDRCVDVSDTLGGDLGSVCNTDANPTVLTYSATVPGVAGTCTDYPNTATFTADDTGATNSDSKSVTLCVGADPTVKKTATPAFTRTYSWNISKSVDKTLIEQSGNTATFNYTVNASETGFTDSGWTVKGTITVTNPNDWEAVTVSVSDAINNGGSCTIDGGNPSLTVLASNTNTANYTCTYASAPSPAAFTNTGKATWDSATYFTPTGSASGTATGDFAATTPSTVNKTITVTDPLYTGGTPKGTLGTLTATDTTPYTTGSFKYSNVVTTTPGVCKTVNNTATITETGQNASQTVNLCNTSTGGLTMGFWQNKNGQGIITSYCGGTGATSLHAFLTSYNPFKDDTASTCAGEANYVTGIIKAANASGSSMNAMLKAQMLATALDVYFSDSSLGGNKTGAPVALGGVKIDLTMVCKMIDSSGGATCSGSYENASPAFGGAASMTVSAMLSFENTVSNAGGSTWYGNVKATQQLAKDAFDAINNQVARIAP